MEPVIRLGDLTSHGGEVISASSTLAYGKQIACVGDLVTCPLPGHDNCEIIEGSEFWKIDGRAVALQGCKTSCGAELLASFDDVKHDREGGGAEAQAAAAELVGQHLAPVAPEDLPRFDEQIRFTLADGSALANTRYKLTLADGSTREGTTSKEGATERVGTEEPVDITEAQFYCEELYCCQYTVEQACAGGRAPEPTFKTRLKDIRTNKKDIGASVAEHRLPAEPEPRALTPGEIAMARTVFKDSIDYGKVKIHDGGLFGWPTISGNAMTPQGEIHFPSNGYRPDYSLEKGTFQVWLIHEMTHVWQYQMDYSVVSAGIQLGKNGGYSEDHAPNQPSPAYRYNLNGEDRGKVFSDFNMEQQAQLVAHYFGATQLGVPDYVSRLPALRRVLDGFLKNPKNPALLPTSTQVEPKP